MNWKKIISIVSISLFILSASLYSRPIDSSPAEPYQQICDWDQISAKCGAPTKDGKFTMNIEHEGTINDNHYRGTWTFSIDTKLGMNASAKAKAMREAINKKPGCPLTAGGEGSYVNITNKNGQMHKWNFASTDGQNVTSIATDYHEGGFSYMGTMEFNGRVNANVDNHEVSVLTNGKTLQQIHQEVSANLFAQGVNVGLDPSGLAFYVFNFSESAGIGSEDDNIDTLGGFADETEPFGITVGMHENIVGTAGSIVTASFDVGNFKFLSDTYKILVTDNSGWEIEPNYLEIFLEPGEIQSIEFNIHIPSPNVIIADNIVNVTATSFTSPWMKSSGLCWVYVNYPPETPTIDGQLKGKVGKPYTYTFVSTAPDGDDVYYCINWSDGTPEVCIGPYAAGEEATATHTWSKKGTYVIKAKAKDAYDAESDWGTLSISMPRLKISNNALLLRLLESFPHAFPIMRHLMRL
jgi:hypothetical protein